MSEQSRWQGRDTLRPQTFNPNDHLIQLKSKDGFRDYLPVQWRLAWFRNHCPHGSIETEILQLDLDRETEEEIEIWDSEKDQYEKVLRHGKGFVVFKATVKDGEGGVGVGTKSEKAASFPDYIEKAETGAIGRALAALGFGTQFAPELSEEHRIVDSPVTRSGPSSRSPNGRDYPLRQLTSAPGNAKSARSAQSPNGHEQIPSAQDDLEAPVTEQQLASIHKLSEYLGKPEPENLASIRYLEAKKLIQHLTAEYREHKQNSKTS